MSNYTENKTPNLIINTVEDPSKLSEITVGENEIVLVPDDTEEEIAKKQDKLVAGTNITLVDDPLTQTTLISSTAQESFFRGKFGRWSQVPTDSTQYDPEPGTQDKTTPTINDFMVIADASDYAGVEVDVFTNEGATILNEYWSVTDFLPISPGTYAKVNYTRTYGQSARGQISLYTENKTLLYSREYQTTTGSGDYTDEFQLPNNCYYVKVQYMTNYDTTEVLTLGGAGMFTGSWRFYYSGVWNADGKSGWKPQYQIENVLPIASDTVAGISKLYTSTGQNTDGSMTQKSVTDALNRIQDSCFRGSWDTWNDVPTVDTLYPEDWKYSHTPTYNDYMVVNDATGYVPSDLLTVELIVTQMNNGDCYYTIGSDTYHKTRQSGQNAPFGPNNEMSWNTLGEGPQGTRITFNDQVKYQNRVYNAGESINLPNVEGSYSVADLPKSFFIKRNVETLTGAWRFSYQGVWATDGKSGWREEYQIENTLPIADSSTLGIAKLYNTTGQNIDGSITQKLFTDTTDNKLDDVKIYGTSKVDRPTKTANLNVVEQCDQTTMPVPSQDLLGRIVQYIGPNGLVSGYVHGYFYECQYVTTESYIELEVIKQPGTQLDTVTCDKDLLEANQGTTTNSWTFISHGGWNEWYLDDEHIDLNDWGIAYQGEPSEDDEIDLDYTEASGRYIWVAIPVQPDAEPISSQEINALWE